MRTSLSGKTDKSGLRARFFLLLALSLLTLAGAGCGPPSSSESQAHPAQLLLVGDPFAYAIDRNLERVDELFGAPVELDIERYSNTRKSILRNARDTVSFYNLVSFDVLWLPKLAADGILQPLTDEDFENIGIHRDKFYPQTLKLSEMNGQLYGLPIQPHFEILFYRKDLLEENGLKPPENFAELLDQARRFHIPEKNQYGVCWNGLRGPAFSQTIAHLYASFGEPILDSEGNARIDTATGRQVLEFLKELMEVSPPDILTMAWDQRINRFARGQSAFTYGWGARSAMLETDPTSQVRGKVGYAIPPGISGPSAQVPFGQWSLGLPANLPPQERKRSLELLKIMMSGDINEVFARSGLESLHRKIPTDTKEVSEYLATSLAIFDQERFSSDARPITEEWTELAEMLGTIFHDALLGRISIEEALTVSQAQADRILASSHGESP